MRSLQTANSTHALGAWCACATFIVLLTSPERVPTNLTKLCTMLEKDINVNPVGADFCLKCYEVTTDCQFYPCVRSLVCLCHVYSADCNSKPSNMNLTTFGKVIEGSIKVNTNRVNICLISYESPYRLSDFDKAFSQAVVLAHGSQYLKNASYEFLETPAFCLL